MGLARLLLIQSYSPSMKQSLTSLRRAFLGFALAALPMAAPAAVTVTGLSSFDAITNRYTYNYSVMNSDSMEEIIQVTFPISPVAALMGYHGAYWFQADLRYRGSPGQFRLG